MRLKSATFSARFRLARRLARTSSGTNGTRTSRIDWPPFSRACTTRAGKARQCPRFSARPTSLPCGKRGLATRPRLSAIIFAQHGLQGHGPRARYQTPRGGPRATIGRPVRLCPRQNYPRGPRHLRRGACDLRCPGFSDTHGLAAPGRFRESVRLAFPRLVKCVFKCDDPVHADPGSNAASCSHANATRRRGTSSSSSSSDSIT